MCWKYYNIMIINYQYSNFSAQVSKMHDKIKKNGPRTAVKVKYFIPGWCKYICWNTGNFNMQETDV